MKSKQVDINYDDLNLIIDLNKKEYLNPAYFKYCSKFNSLFVNETNFNCYETIIYR